ncbi:hypothetical protein [Maricaulis sp.]|uniref:hypothetical protein n=1 Tax=Maricaulis sp. TaxID=1486257 RepID=UPI003A8D0A8E
MLISKTLRGEFGGAMAMLEKALVNFRQTEPQVLQAFSAVSGLDARETAAAFSPRTLPRLRIRGLGAGTLGRFDANESKFVTLDMALINALETPGPYLRNHQEEHGNMGVADIIVVTAMHEMVHWARHAKRLSKSYCRYDSDKGDCQYTPCKAGCRTEAGYAFEARLGAVYPQLRPSGNSCAVG